MLFPRYLSSQSPKLTNRWKGHFKVLEKCTDVTYNVDCGGPRRKPQIIHIDRMWLKRAQRLEYETENSDRQGNEPNDEPVSTNDSRSNDSGE